MNTLEKALYAIGNLWYDAEDFAKKWSRILMISSILLIGLTIISVCMKSQSVMYVTMIMSSLMFLATWYSSNLFASVIEGAGKSLPTNFLKDGTSAIGQELKKLFFIFCTFSLTTSFISFVVILFGFDFLSMEVFAGIVAAALFFTVAGLCLGTNTKLAAIVMIAAVVILSGKYYFVNSPDIVAETIRDRSGKVAGAVHNKNLKAQAKKYIINAMIKSDVLNVYEQNGNNLSKVALSLSKGTTVRLQHSKNGIKYFYEQPFVKILLENITNFTGGKEYWVEAEYVLWADKKQTEYVPGEYMLIKENEDTWYISFLTDDRISISLHEKKGKIVLFTGANRGDVQWTHLGKPGELCELKFGTRIINNRFSSEFKYRKGGFIKIDWS